MTAAKRLVHSAALAVVGGCFFIVLALQLWRVPQHMDEHGSYHTTACNAHPFSRFHIYRESCGGVYDIRVLDWFTLYNSCSYMGESVDLLFRPFYYLIPGHAAPFAFCLFFWALSVAAAGRMLRIPVGIAFIGCGMNFAFLYHLLHDPETLLPTLLMAVIPLLAVRSVTARRPDLYGLAAGLLAAVAFEGKLFFAYLVPLVAVLTFGAVAATHTLNRDTLRLLLRFCSNAAMAGGIPALLLLSGRTPQGDTYLQSQLHMAGAYGAGGMAEYWGNVWAKFSFFWFDFGNVMHRVYNPQPAGFSPAWLNTALLTGIFWMICVATIAAALMLEWKRRLLPVRLAAFVPAVLLGAVITTLLVATNREAWTHHHYFFAVTPVFFAFALSLAALWKRPWGRSYVVPALACVLAVLSLLSTYAKSLQAPHNHSSARRDQMLWWLRQPENAARVAAVHIDWGSYYTAALIGPPEQMVLFMTHVSSTGALENIKKDSKSAGRVPVFIRGRSGVSLHTIDRQLGPLYNITSSVIKQAPPNALVRVFCTGTLNHVLPYTCERWRAIDRYGSWEIWSTTPQTTYEAPQ